jgi:hypothetical protein
MIVKVAEVYLLTATRNKRWDSREVIYEREVSPNIIRYRRCVQR